MRLSSPKRRTLSAALVATLVACGTPMQIFRHESHREIYLLEAGELSELHFYVSIKVVAHRQDDSAGTSDSVLILDPDVPGVVTGTGDRWMRVSFGAGTGATFLAGRGDSEYLLARRGEGGVLQTVASSPEKTIAVDGIRYAIRTGANARLLVDTRDLETLLERRTRLQGRTPRE